MGMLKPLLTGVANLGKVQTDEEELDISINRTIQESTEARPKTKPRKKGSKKKATTTMVQNQEKDSRASDQKASRRPSEPMTEEPTSRPILATATDKRDTGSIKDKRETRIQAKLAKSESAHSKVKVPVNLYEDLAISSSDDSDKADVEIVDSQGTTRNRVRHNH